MEKDVIRFKDFLGESLSDRKKELLSEILSDDNSDEMIDSDESIIAESLIAEDLESDTSTDDFPQEEDYYKIFTDKNENFICDIHIEGASLDKSQVRLIIESENWNLMIPGDLIDGKCVIPLKKLDLLPENQCGKIKLEVIAEGSVIVPWEKTYKVCRSKKVTVNLNRF